MYHVQTVADLNPLQEAFLDDFRKGWNLACEHLDDRTNRVDAAKARYRRHRVGAEGYARSWQPEANEAKR
jgi:hypothetical protein